MPTVKALSISSARETLSDAETVRRQPAVDAFRLYEQLPEAGDLEKPKLVFFLTKHICCLTMHRRYCWIRLSSDKAYPLERRGRLVRFAKPVDIPDNVLGQLGNRVQHALRALRPKIRKQ